MIHAIKGDITKITNVSAIVNAANESLLGGGGVGGAIHRAAGPRLLAECTTLGGCKAGEAKITKAYQLPCDYVIHTVGPRWHGGNHNEPETLARCYRSSLTLAMECGIKTIAFPSISTGVFGYPVNSAAQVAIQTAKDFTEENPGAFKEIYWVLFDDATYKTYEKAIETILG